MKPDWDKLGDKYNGGDSVMIVDVDCTGPGEQTCSKMGVKGYPTIKYFKDGDKKGKDYQGGRDFAALKQFVDSTLDVATCDAVTKKHCAPNEIKFIEEHEVKTAEELAEVLKTKDEELKAVKDENKVETKAFKEKEKAWKKKEKALGKAKAILKQLEKSKK